MKVLIFKQIKQRGDNFSYVIANETTKEAAVVDPSFNTDAIIRIVKDNGLHIKYVIDTHQHWDHVAGNDNLRALGAKIVAHKSAKCFKDVDVSDGEVIKIDDLIIKVIHTPGHTPDSICLLVDGKLLTGDTLFVGECGRVDLPGGSAEDMYNSLFEKLMKLDDSTEVYPGHDYGPKPHSTIGIERKNNYTLKKRTLDEFFEFMQEP